MAYSPTNDFDASGCGYEAPDRLDVDFDRAQLPGSTHLNLCGEVGGTNLNLGNYAEEAPQEPSDEYSLAVSAKTRRASGAVLLAQIIPATVTAVTKRPTATVYVADVRVVAVGCTTRRARGIVGVAYDPNLLSDVVHLAKDDWRSALLSDSPAKIVMPVGAALYHGGRAPWLPGGSQAISQRPEWMDSPLGTRDSGDAWDPGLGRRNGPSAAWAGGAFYSVVGADQWRTGRLSLGSGEGQWHPHPPHYAPPIVPVEGPTGFVARTIQGYPPGWWEVDFPGSYSWARREPRAGRPIEGWKEGRHATHAAMVKPQRHGAMVQDPLALCWRDGGLVYYVFRPPVVEPPVQPPWEHWGNNLCLRIPLADALLDLGLPPCPGAEPPPEPGGVVPIRRVYFVLTHVSLTRLDTEVEVPATQLSISLDMDSWAWVWSASLVGPNAVALVTPGQDGAPVVVVAEVNGHTWHLLAEDWTETREFGSRSIRVSGRGLSAWLGTPYEPAASGTLGNARTLAQAMGELLPLGSGWTLDWAPGTPDWLLPAGSWNWQNQSPIQAIHAAAQGVGLVVVPAMADKVLTVQPRYPVLPWHFADATPHLTLPDAAILSVSRRQAVPTQANAVYVHGGDAGGIIARVWRTGTAADRLATTASAEQITQVDGARLLGERLLAGQGQQPHVRSFTLPLGGVFVLAQLGELVSLELGGEDVRGIVNGVAITAQNATVQQTVTIGEDTPNAWALWRRLLPDNPLLLGAVAVIHADGTRTVELAGGGRQRVRGESAVGTNVWVRSGMIEGQAPDLPSYEVEVF